MRKFIAAASVCAVAFTFQPTASPRSETAPIEPVLKSHAERVDGARTFMAEVNRAYRLVAYIETLRAQHNAAVMLAAAAATAKRSEAQRRTRAGHGGTTSSARVRSTSSSGRCGGDLPPCYVMQRESGGSLTAENPRSTASGKWQFLDSTWNGYGGYSHASDAPESVQDARAREVWNGGAGCSNWLAC